MCSESVRSCVHHYRYLAALLHSVLLGTSKSLLQSESLLHPLEVDVSPLRSSSREFLYNCRVFLHSIIENRIPWSGIIGIILSHAYYFARDVVPIVYMRQKKPIPRITRAPMWLWERMWRLRCRRRLCGEVYEIKEHRE